MRIDNGYYVWDRGESTKINDYFNTNEFSCKCSNSTCKESRISIKLVEKLTDMRKAVGPLRITSAFRCKEHQASLRKSGILTAVGTSTHELGDAADILAIGKPIDVVLAEAPKHFKAIGIAKTFIHVDLRDDKERRWPY